MTFNNMATMVLQLTSRIEQDLTKRRFTVDDILVLKY